MGLTTEAGGAGRRPSAASPPKKPQTDYGGQIGAEEMARRYENWKDIYTGKTLSGKDARDWLNAYWNKEAEEYTEEEIAFIQAQGGELEDDEAVSDFAATQRREMAGRSEAA